MFETLVVNWHMNPEIFSIGPVSLRWYSVLFVSGFVLGWFIFRGFFRREGVPETLLDPLLYTLLIGTIVGADFSMDGSHPHRLTIDDGSTIEADTVIISTGASAKYLGLDDEKKYQGLGVSACATCDGFFYRKKTVAVVGGGDTACEEAQYLASLCKKVYMIVRRDVLRASEAMQKKVMETENIEILWNTQVRGLYGQDGVEGAHLSTGQDLAIDGLFLAIGHHPNSDVFRPALECDAEGYIIVKHPTTETNIPGVFACGDVADPIYRQAISAAGSGCHAAMDARKYLSEKQ